MGHKALGREINMDRMGTVQSLPVTPFFDDGRIDEKSLRRLTDYQVEGGVDGIMALGRIGETYGMSVEENKQCMRIVAEQVDKRVLGCRARMLLVGRVVDDVIITDSLCQADLAPGARHRSGCKNHSTNNIFLL